MSLSAEQMKDKFFTEYQKINPSVTHNPRKDGNYSVKATSHIFAYIDFVKSSLIACLKLDPSNNELQKFKGLFRNYTLKHPIGSWDLNGVTEIVMDDETNIKLYIQMFEIARKVN